MNIFLVWATNSGTTQTVAHMVNDALTAAGHTVTMKEARETTPEDFTSPQAIIIGSPSWDFDSNEGFPHEDFLPLMEKLKTATVAKPFAIFGLGDSSYKFFTGAVDHFEEFVKNIKGTLLVPSLRIDKFYSDQTGNTEKVNAWLEELKKKLTT